MKEVISGVYKITNTITGDFYIGSSKDTKGRWASHKRPSMWKHLPNSRLYHDMIQYELTSFTFEILEETDNLKEREQYWIDQLKPSYNSNRAEGHDIERYKEVNRQSRKAWRKSHLSKQASLMRAWYKMHQTECLAKKKAYYNRLCLYEGETLTLNTLSTRFRRQGIIHPTIEAKKYLIVK